MSDQPTVQTRHDASLSQPYRRPHVKLVGPRPAEVRQPVGRFVSGQLERHKTKRAAGSRARIALRHKTDV